MKLNRKLAFKIIIPFILILLVFFGVKTYLLGQQPGFKTTQVKKGTIAQIVSASGEIKADKAVDLKFQISGELVWVGVKEGDEVKAGQAIAQLNREELKKNLEKALRDYSSERNDFEESNRITYRGQSPQTALTDTIKRILEKNQWDLEQAVLDVELKDIALKYSTLISPISGIVTRVDTPVAGVNIVYTGAVFSIADPSSTIFRAEVDESDIGLIEKGQQAKINLDAYYDEGISGNVEKISFSSITTSGGGTAYLVDITLPENINKKFKIGMNGDAEIIIVQKENALIVPSEAVTERNGEKFVKILEEEKEKEVGVETGVASETETEILSGLTDGQEIILSSEK